MTVLKAQAEPKELIDFLTTSGVKNIDIDAMKIKHHSDHVFEKNGKIFYIMIIYTDGHYKNSIEKALIDNNREFKWQ
jgi:hypothetical protein